MTLKADPAYAALAEHIAALGRDGPLIYVPNPGNWGDALIQAGERAFFRHFGLRVREFSLRKAQRWTRVGLRLRARSIRPVLLYGGGGAFSPHYPKHVAAVVRLAQRVGRGLILPSSMDIPPSDLELPGSFCLYRRDARDRYFCHDMALFLDPAPRKVVEAVGYLFRQDAEALPGAPLPPGSRDISAEGDDASDPERFFDQVGHYAEIHTDRLHIAIAGALLGRRVHVYPAFSSKVKKVFELSLAPHYSCVSFHPDRYVLPNGSSAAT